MGWFMKLKLGHKENKKNKLHSGTKRHCERLTYVHILLLTQVMIHEWKKATRLEYTRVQMDIDFYIFSQLLVNDMIKKKNCIKFYIIQSMCHQDSNTTKLLHDDGH